ncbi:MAG: efflux RND transporter periplasmic adaptor subunit [Prevotellaceae bacterium]|nr:efflux RND transporter periplasmic adaptor subunit [Prevotellaceae bacterium]
MNRYISKFKILEPSNLKIVVRVRILKYFTGFFITVFCLLSCVTNGFKYDASGAFEAVEVMVSAEASGKLESFAIKEGDSLRRGDYLGYVDSTQLFLKKLQLLTAQKAVNSRRPDISVQISATKEQILKAELEKTRVENLYRDSVATQKQLDDAISQLNVLKKSLNAQINSLTTSVNSLSEEGASYEIQVAQLDDQIYKCKVINPIDGIVLNKYAEEKEIVFTGKSLYKIADVRNMFLRAYIVSTQLENVKIGQQAEVIVSQRGEEKIYKGTITWISNKAEFTPKTIQTKDERENLAYAVKIAVENTDGFLRIGMYGDVKFLN